MANATKTKAQEKTAAEMYADAASGASAILDLIGQEMKRHAENAAENPNNWCFVTEMEWLRSRFSEILMTLIGGEKEEEVARMISDHLEEMSSLRVVKIEAINFEQAREAIDYAKASKGEYTAVMLDKPMAIKTSEADRLTRTSVRLAYLRERGAEIIAIPNR